MKQMLWTALLSLAVLTISNGYAGDPSASLGQGNDATRQPDRAGGARPATFLRSRNVPLKIPIASLLTNTSLGGVRPATSAPARNGSVKPATSADAGRDRLHLARVSSSKNGAALRTNATYVLYDAPSARNATDSFTHSVSDGSTTADGIVLVSLAAEPTGTNFNQVAYGLVNGKPTSTFVGVPRRTYAVQRTQDLAGVPAWTTLWTTNAPATALFQFVDQAPPEGRVFYRAINQ